MAVRTEAPPIGEILRKGDPITIVYGRPLYGESPILLHTFVTHRRGDGAVIDVTLPRSFESLRLDDEGRGWVRGHQLLDSPVVRAALAAQGI